MPQAARGLAVHEDALLSCPGMAGRDTAGEGTMSAREPPPAGLGAASHLRTRRNQRSDRRVIPVVRRLVQRRVAAGIPAATTLCFQPLLSSAEAS